jgi:hypothetical protein
LILSQEAIRPKPLDWRKTAIGFLLTACAFSIIIVMAGGSEIWWLPFIIMGMFPTLVFLGALGMGHPMIEALRRAFGGGEDD